MIKRLNVYFIVLMFPAFMAACDIKNPVVAIRNNSTHVLIGTALSGPLVDSDVYQNQVAMNIHIPPGQFQDVALPNFKPGLEPDSSKLYLYIFYDNSLAKYSQQKVKGGIIAKTLIEKKVIQLNKVKRVDTIYIK